MANLKNGTLNYFLTKDLDALENRENALKEMNKMDPTYPDPNDPRFTDPAPVFTILDNSLYRDNVLVGRIYDNKTNKLINITSTLDTNVTAYDTEESATGQDIPIPTVEKLTGTKFTIEEAPDPYEYVDFGLPSGTLWAKMNVGATKETEIGNFYQWGKGTRTYDETYGEPDTTSAILSPEQDTATLAWGLEWHTPVAGQMRELIEHTDHYFVSNFNNTGVKGEVFVSRTDDSKYIFIPAGYLGGTSETSDCYLWSSYELENHMFCTYVVGVGPSNKNAGFAVRPVKFSKTTPNDNLIVYRSALKILNGYSMRPTAFSSTMLIHEFAEGLGSIWFEENLTYIKQGFIDEDSSRFGILNVCVPGSITELSGINYSTTYYIDIPDSVVTLGGFKTLPLITINISNNVTEIQNSAFENCRKMITAEIGSGVLTIGEYAFSHYWSRNNEMSLKAVTIKATTPPVLGEYVFKELKSGEWSIIPSIKAILVPEESVNTYKTAEGWSEFAHLIYPIGTDSSVYNS